MTEKDQLSSTNVVSSDENFHSAHGSVLEFFNRLLDRFPPRRFDVENKFVFRQFSTRWKTAREREGGGELNDF